MNPLMYKNFDPINQNGVFCFLNMESCFACSEYMKELAQYDTKNWTMVILGDDDSEDFKSKGFTTPLTRIYVAGRIEHEVGGILYSSQVRDIYNKLASFSQVSSTGKPIAANTIPEVVVARHKQIEVSCLKATSFLSMNILGQDIEIRPNQYLVMYDDNKLEVLNEEDFNRRFEI